LGQVGVDFVDCLINLVDVVFLAEGFEVVTLLLKAALDFKNV